MNYKHLHYFWTVVRAGGVARAAEQLHLTPQTLSGQIHLLEDRLGQPLLRRVGRGVEATDAGRMAMQYADEIFSLGAELEEALRTGVATSGAGMPVRAPVVRVGIADSVPKAIAYRMVEPALRMEPLPRLHCTEGKLAALLGELALRRLELVLSDVPMPGHLGVKAFTHLLGRSGLVFFASAELLGRHGLSPRKASAKLYETLAALPLLMPGSESALRPRLEAWLRQHGLAPRVAGEFDDSALMKAFGREGRGAFAAPQVLAEEIAQQYQVLPLGVAPGLTEEFYGISVERRITHPAVAAITDTARRELFGVT